MLYLPFICLLSSYLFWSLRHEVSVLVSEEFAWKGKVQPYIGVNQGALAGSSAMVLKLVCVCVNFKTGRHRTAALKRARPRGGAPT